MSKIQSPKRPLFLSSDSGVAAVEFALIAPILILLIIGLVDMGNYIRERMKLEQMSRASVDYIMQGGSEQNIETAIIAFYDTQNPQSYEISTDRVCTCSDGVAQSCSSVICDQGDHSRQYVEVSLNKTFTPLFSYPGIPDEMVLTGHARMRLD